MMYRFIGWKLICALAALLVVALLNGPLLAASIVVGPISSGQAQDSGSGYVMRSYLAGPNQAWVGPADQGMERLITEYDLSSITQPITSATLTINVGSFSYGGGSYPTLHIFGYQGDNAASSDDATRTQNEWVTYLYSTGAGVFTVPLPTSTVESYRNSSAPSLGLLYTVTSPSGTDFVSINLNPPRPRLTLEYLPEPGSAWLAAVGIALCLRRGKRVRSGSVAC